MRGPTQVSLSPSVYVPAHPHELLRVLQRCLVRYGLRSCGSLVVRNWCCATASCRLSWVHQHARTRTTTLRSPRSLFQTVNSNDGTCSSNNWRCRGGTRTCEDLSAWVTINCVDFRAMKITRYHCPFSSGRIPLDCTQEVWWSAKCWTWVRLQVQWGWRCAGFRAV